MPSLCKSLNVEYFIQFCFKKRRNCSESLEINIGLKKFLDPGCDPTLDLDYNADRYQNRIVCFFGISPSLLKISLTSISNFAHEILLRDRQTDRHR